MTDFPVSPEQMTPALLTAYLGASGVLPDSTEVVALQHQLIGTGKMGDNARLMPQYSRDAGDAPTSLIAKLPASDEHARAIAGAQGAYYNEVMFYRELAPLTAMRTPVIYASELSEDHTEFLLLMEDLSPAEPGNQLVGESRERALLALAQVAKLAGAFYGDASLAGRDYVLSGRDDGGAFGQQLLEQSWPGFLDRFGAALAPESIAFGERYIRGHAHFATRFEGPRTVAHGDFRSENILFAAAGATTVDWQTVGESSALTDAAYFLGGSLEVKDRRSWERALIEEYRILLEQSGAVLSAQDCWNQYREYAMHGLLITILGASFSSPDPRGDQMFQVMIQRHLQHCLDVEAGEFLPA